VRQADRPRRRTVRHREPACVGKPAGQHPPKASPQLTILRVPTYSRSSAARATRPGPLRNTLRAAGGRGQEHRPVGGDRQLLHDQVGAGPEQQRPRQPRRSLEAVAGIPRRDVKVRMPTPSGFYRRLRTDSRFGLPDRRHPRRNSGATAASRDSFAFRKPCGRYRFPPTSRSVLVRRCERR
jgi:hypothetical protein